MTQGAPTTAVALYSMPSSQQRIQRSPPVTLVCGCAAVHHPPPPLNVCRRMWGGWKTLWVGTTATQGMGAGCLGLIAPHRCSTSSSRCVLGCFRAKPSTRVLSGVCLVCAGMHVALRTTAAASEHRRGKQKQKQQQQHVEEDCSQRRRRLRCAYVDPEPSNMLCLAVQEPFLAVVVDPVRTMASGKVSRRGGTRHAQWGYDPHLVTFANFVEGGKGGGGVECGTGVFIPHTPT